MGDPHADLRAATELTPTIKRLYYHARWSAGGSRVEVAQCEWLDPSSTGGYADVARRAGEREATMVGFQIMHGNPKTTNGAVGTEP
jgi:hypothetical protein